ncbi:carbohydrate ABC transporter permease [Paenibacillus sp. LHD-117]|uniref:carbohydrate ABC transporter permease n=1 Tax=Paenibacillus sp. LHD-117 TaxID=3071412 RepID=UPI0027DFC31B|nr:carbohydrate ABC transporter permease [Paenibacillus sp. LHD-117]MDQ6419988.1 carbohydrate ABC transporter permease [Paenibacillus sp. LHD-117]
MVTRSYGNKMADVLLYAIMTVVLFITLYPFWTQVVISLDGGDAAYRSFQLIPSMPTFDSYKLALEFDALWVGYKNTIIRTCLGVVISILATSITAYPLSKPDLPLNKWFTRFMLIQFIIGGGLIPNYLLIKYLGMYNTIWALVIPAMLSTFNVLIMRNFFRSLPLSLEESAMVDGAGYMTILAKVVLPLSMPIIATLSLWVAVYHWNAWFDALIYTNNPNKEMLQLVLRRIIILNNPTQFNDVLTKLQEKSPFSGRQLQATVIMLSILPMLIVYPFIQKYFVKGIMVGAVKG